MGCNCGKKFTKTVSAPVPEHILQEAAKRMQQSASTSIPIAVSSAASGSGENTESGGAK